MRCWTLCNREMSSQGQGQGWGSPLMSDLVPWSRPEPKLCWLLATTPSQATTVLHQGYIRLCTTTKIPRNSILASIDVSSLYTNIPHADGIKASVDALKRNQNPHPLRPNAELLEVMLNIVLKSNVFEFNEDYFLQLQGTVMGTKMAPAYANLFMGSLEPTLTNLGYLYIMMCKR